nr:ABC transporter transmembrane domain-containing protein [Paenibacillus turpanensis]
MGKLKWFFVNEKKRYAIAISLLILGGILEILPPKLIGDAIDAIHLGQLTGPEMWRTILGYSVLLLLTYFINYIWSYQLFGAAHLVERKLRTSFMGHLLKMTPTFYEKNRTGDLMARATNDLKAVSATAGFGILTLVDSTVWMTVLLVTMSTLISWKLTLASLLPLPLIALMMSIYGKIIHERFTAAQNAFGEMNDGVLETVSGVRVVRAYVQEEAEQRRFRQTTEEVYGKNMAVARIESLFEPTMKVMVGASYLIGLGYGAYLVFKGEITLGKLVSFNVYLGMLIWPMFAIGELINIMQRGSASLDRVNETLNYKADVADAADAGSTDRGAANSSPAETSAAPKTAQAAAQMKPGILRFEDVAFRYPSSTTDNLKDIHFTLEPGQTLGIVGRTGSGKTTLLKQLIREYPYPSEGSITLGDLPLNRIPLERLHGWIGYVPQEQILFSKTVRENIRFGKPDATEGEIERALGLAAFLQDLNTLPKGLDTLVGEKGVALSGGQKQRISIARAMIADPELLILDDAMSAVDAKTESAIIEGIRRERKGKTTLISTHRLSAVQHADVILVLDEGRIVQRGTHAVLAQQPGWYQEQYIRQQSEETLGTRS